MYSTFPILTSHFVQFFYCSLTLIRNREFFFFLIRSPIWCSAINNNALNMLLIWYHRHTILPKTQNLLYWHPFVLIKNNYQWIVLLSNFVPKIGSVHLKRFSTLGSTWKAIKTLYIKSIFLQPVILSAWRRMKSLLTRRKRASKEKKGRASVTEKMCCIRETASIKEKRSCLLLEPPVADVFQVH